jgi:hypothetical protein
MSIIRCSAATALLVLAALLNADRCAAGEGLATVKGKVSLDGQPLTSGKIVFHLPDGQFAGAKLQADGTFQVDRLPPGALKVSFEATRGNGKGQVVNLLPARYSSEERSEIKIEVRKGANTHDFELQSK